MKASRDIILSYFIHEFIKSFFAFNQEREDNRRTWTPEWFFRVLSRDFAFLPTSNEGHGDLESFTATNYKVSKSDRAGEATHIQKRCYLQEAALSKMTHGSNLGSKMLSLLALAMEPALCLVSRFDQDFLNGQSMSISQILVAPPFAQASVPGTDFEEVWRRNYPETIQRLFQSTFLGQTASKKIGMLKVVYSITSEGNCLASKFHTLDISKDMHRLHRTLQLGISGTSYDQLRTPAAAFLRLRFRDDDFARQMQQFSDFAEPSFGLHCIFLGSSCTQRTHCLLDFIILRNGNWHLPDARQIRQIQVRMHPDVTPLNADAWRFCCDQHQPHALMARC